MVFVKGSNRLKEVGYYNTDVFESIRIKVTENNISVCGIICQLDYIETIILRESFPSEEEAENWLLSKGREWGILITDPNH